MAKGLANLAPRRRRLVTDADIAALRGKLTLDFSRSASAIDAEALEAWNSFIPVSPAAAYAILTRELPPGVKVNFDRLCPSGNASISIRKDSPRGNEIFSDERSFNFREGTAGAGLISVADSRQDRGMGRRLMRNQIEFLHACGITRLNITAGLGNGGYTWARAGFLPTLSHTDTFRRAVINRARGQLKRLRPVLDADTRRRAADYLRFREPRDMWRVADLSCDLVPLLAPAFSRAAAGYRPGQQACADLRGGFGDAFRRAVRDDRRLPLGRVLLAGTNWEGTLDLNDKRQMKRMGAYCGGWKYIKV